ncbi:MAG: phosphoketolase family protein [Clostridia bacterium]|nr:phosphoketolase family protein [Clostridia bacterium]
MKKNYYSTDEYFEKLNRYWQASNYLAVGQLYLLDNPLLERPLQSSDIKRKIVGHWGTVPGQNFIYTHLNRVINKYDQNMILISGPGHGGNFFVSHSYLEGAYSGFYPNVSLDKDGMKKLFKQFSFPCGISSHVAPEVPGSMHEGGELGYSLAHAFGAVFDNPDLVATCIVGDGEAETGPLACAWHSNKFISAKDDGAVLPILHLNGFKISNPTVLSRISKEELNSLLCGYGWKPYFVEGEDPATMHRLMADAMDKAIEEIHQIQHNARCNNDTTRPLWPMIVLRTPKGWTAPKYVDGVMIEGSFNAHQVPISMNKPEHLSLLEDWMRSYEPEKLFDKGGRLLPELQELAPKGNRRISANPITNGGVNVFDLKLPNLDDCGVEVDGSANVKAQDMLELGKYLAKVISLNECEKNFRIFSPDEAKSNRLTNVFDVTNRIFALPSFEPDEFISNSGRVIDSYLSEHCCEGWLEGYNLTGRHGIFATYEAFARVVDSMVSQHIKWIKICKSLNWRKPIPSLNLILTSNVWQQDHNGFTHQDPGMIDHICDKKGDIGRVYLPPDANCLIACMDHCLQTKNYVNAIVASKHPTHQWLSMEQAKAHCSAGVGEWKFASKNSEKPDFIIACCGSTPTIEAVALAELVKEKLPYLNFKFINIVDLMRLQQDDEHPHGLSNEEYDKIFDADIPTIFAYHGYPKLIHELCYKRANSANLHVAGYREEGAITTAFDMRVLNKVDRFNLLKMVLKFVDKVLPKDKESLTKFINDKLVEHKKYIAEYGVDLPEIENWKLK